MHPILINMKLSFITVTMGTFSQTEKWILRLSCQRPQMAAPNIRIRACFFKCRASYPQHDQRTARSEGTRSSDDRRWQMMTEGTGGDRSSQWQESHCCPCLSSVTPQVMSQGHELGSCARVTPTGHVRGWWPSVMCTGHTCGSRLWDMNWGHAPGLHPRVTRHRTVARRSAVGEWPETTRRSTVSTGNTLYMSYYTRHMNGCL